jgi:hypothetical protein
VGEGEAVGFDLLDERGNGDDLVLRDDMYECENTFCQVLR